MHFRNTCTNGSKINIVYHHQALSKLEFELWSHSFLQLFLPSRRLSRDRCTCNLENLFFREPLPWQLIPFKKQLFHKYYCSQQAFYHLWHIINKHIIIITGILLQWCITEYYLNAISIKLLVDLATLATDDESYSIYVSGNFYETSDNMPL